MTGVVSFMRTLNGKRPTQLTVTSLPWCCLACLGILTCAQNVKRVYWHGGNVNFRNIQIEKIKGVYMSRFEIFVCVALMAQCIHNMMMFYAVSDITKAIREGNRNR